MRPAPARGVLLDRRRERQLRYPHRNLPAYEPGRACSPSGPHDDRRAAALAPGSLVAVAATGALAASRTATGQTAALWTPFTGIRQTDIPHDASDLGYTLPDIRT